MRVWRFSFLLPLALVAGCGDLPRPFQGNPGPVAAHLALPPPPLLTVPAPHDALLPARDSVRFAKAVATALAERTVPAVAGPPTKGDWTLSIGANLQNNEIIPRYTVVDPLLRRQGSIAGAPVSAAAWAAGNPDTFKETAAADAGPIAGLLTQIDARLKRSNPESLMNRRPRVYFAGVLGAPGDGDGLLTGAMRHDLPASGVPLQEKSRGADFTITGKVKVTPAQPAQRRVEVQWVVTDARGRERGRVVQLNQVPAAEIEPSWSEVAPEIAGQAASGVHELIEKAREAP